MKKIILTIFFLLIALLLPAIAQSQPVNGIHHGAGPLRPSISHQPMTRQPMVMKSNTRTNQLTIPMKMGATKALDTDQSLLNKAFNSSMNKAPRRLSADNVVGDKIMLMLGYDYDSDSGKTVLIDNYLQGGWNAIVTEESPGVLKVTDMYYYLPVTINVSYSAKTAEMEMGTLATFQWSNTVGSTQYDTTQVVMVVNEDYILNAPNGNLTNIPGTLNDEGSLHFTDGYCYYIIDYCTKTRNGNVSCDTISFRTPFFRDTYLMTPNGKHQYDRVLSLDGNSFPAEINVYMYQADDTTAVIWNMWGDGNRNMVMYIHEDGTMEFPSLQLAATLDTIYYNENHPGVLLRNGAFNYAVELLHENDSDYIDPWSGSTVSTFGTVTPTEIAWDASILYCFESYDEGNTWQPIPIWPYYLHNKLTFTDGSQWFEYQEEPIDDGLNYRYEDNGNAIVIAGEIPYSGDIVIPETTVHDGRTYTVTAIDSIAFMNCTELTSVIIGDSITSIGFRAFSGCTGMKSISIGKSVDIVRGPAFADCTGLTSVNIKDLEAWCRIKFACYQAQPCLYAHHLLLDGEEITDPVIPNTITEIKSQTFIGCNITSVTLHNGITAIGNMAFRNCRYLSGDLIIPSSVTSIGNEAFSGCTSLSSITIPNTITTINYGVFRGCSGLTRFVIPNSVTTIGNEAFYICSKLSSINIPNSVTSIGNRAFANCDSLATIEMPNSVSFIGESAFEYCYALRSINIPNSISAINKNTFRCCTSLTSITIPNSVTSIGYLAFSTCSKLKNISIGNSVTLIGIQAFEYCDEINEIDIPSSVDSIGSCAFRSCKGLIRVSLSNNLTTIDSGTFSNCSNLTSISLGNSLKTISHEAFKSCTSLTSIDIPNSVTSIETDAFYACSSMTNLTFGNSVTRIGYRAFQGCSGLTTLTIPSSVNSISHNAFAGCRGLTDVYSYIEDPTQMFIGASMFPSYSNVDSHALTLHVPANTIDLYQSTSWPLYFSSIVEMNDSHGDANGDGFINISDATNLINYLLTDNAEGCNLANADVNGDGFINISDVTALINILLQQ